MAQTATEIFKKIGDLEREVQQLKLRAFFNLPQSQRNNGIYSMSDILKSLKATRKDIWQKRYAKKVGNHFF